MATMKDDSTKIPVQLCWKCGYKMDHTSHAFGDATPGAGDYSMCLACGAVSVFNADMMLREPNPEEKAAIATKL